MASVYKKTPKGQEEVDHHQHGLARKLRAVLIMVDGRTDHATLSARAVAMGEAASAIDYLLSEGYIVPAGGQVAAPPSPAQHGGAPVAAANPVKAAPAKAPGLDCPLHKPRCMGNDCIMIYGCKAAGKRV